MLTISREAVAPVYPSRRLLEGVLVPSRLGLGVCPTRGQGTGDQGLSSCRDSKQEAGPCRLPQAPQPSDSVSQLLS